jgi:excinuclease ABC subunit C
MWSRRSFLYSVHAMTKDDLKQFNLPDEPGIYMFRNEKREILYIGKAAVLKDRVKSYFAKDLIESRSPAIAKMVIEASEIVWQTTDNVLEALILEANEIKKNQPPYNSASKDNKSFNYLVITKEDFPRVLIVRGRELFQNLPRLGKGKAGWNEAKIRSLFGPFPQGLSLQEAVKIVRKIFPFRDNKCTPCSEQKKAPCRPCFNRQIGLCPGVCTGEVTKEEYMETIRHITELFKGNFKGLKRQLTKEMKDAAKAEDFEKANRLKRQCSALEHIKDVSLIKNERVSAGGGSRVEAYDVAHTGGSETVGVMTVVDNGEAYKAAYRKFKINSVTNDDVAALTEMLERRLEHTEWPLPRVFAVDGGKGQMRAAERVLKKAGVEIPIVGVVKNEFHKPERLIGDKRCIAAYERDILLANNEAHRFAITWHRNRLRKGLSV